MNEGRPASFVFLKRLSDDCIPDMKKEIAQQHRIPKSLKNVPDWQVSRKEFLRTLLAASLLTSIPVSKLFGQTGPYTQSVLNEDQKSILKSIQEILFPSDENGPGADELNAFDYLIWVVSDPNKDPGEVDYIINGIAWVDETANEEYSKNYNDLSQKEKEELVAEISRERWGGNWLSVILTFIFEALLCDPQYGGNQDNIGWKWLDHNPGQPRPTKKLLYPGILTTMRES